MNEMDGLRARAGAGDASALRRLDELTADRNAAVYDAVRGLDTIWESLCENAGHFSCGEIEILIDVLHAAGMDDLGASIRWHHAQDDDDDGDYESHRALIDTPEPGSF
jgi:hypothetical protein